MTHICFHFDIEGDGRYTTPLTFDLTGSDDKYLLVACWDIMLPLDILIYIIPVSMSVFKQTRLVFCVSGTILVMLCAYSCSEARCQFFGWPTIPMVKLDLRCYIISYALLFLPDVFKWCIAWFYMTSISATSSSSMVKIFELISIPWSIRARYTNFLLIANICNEINLDTGSQN